MAARRLSRLQRRILRHLLALHQRTRGTLAMSHLELVQALGRDRSNVGHSLQGLSTNGTESVNKDYVYGPPAAGKLRPLRNPREQELLAAYPLAQSRVPLIGALDFCESADMQNFPCMHGPNVSLGEG
jgi:hypothetical protein